MNQSFSAQFFAGNRARLKERVGDKAPIVLTANGLLQSGGDTSYPFHQDASFWYFTGCDEPDVVLVCDKEEEYLIIPTRASSRVAFDGTIDERRLSQLSGIKLIVHQEEGWKRLNARLAKTKQVALVAAPPNYIEQFGLYTNPARRALVDKLQAHQPNLRQLDISRDIARLRVIKQPVEIAAVQKAIDITVAGLSHAFHRAEQGVYHYEYEFETELSYEFRRRGAKGHAFAPIVASGEHACILHNVANDGPLENNQLLLCDVGAEYDHYAADISRTVCLGTPTARQIAVHAAVEVTQTYALSLLHPGTILKQYELKVEQFLGKQLGGLGLISSNTHKQVRKYMPHATSHFLGLNAHDVGLYDQPLQAGMVVTAEPGIYIPDEAIGVRIEDDVLITENGHKLLSGNLSHSLS